MDRYLQRDRAGFQPGVVDCFMEFTAGTSGAVPALTAFARRAGIRSVVLTATGIYTVTFQDSVVALLDFHVDILQATYSVTAAGKVVVKPAEVLVSAATPTIALRCYTTNGVATAAALTAGDVLKASFTLQRLQSAG